MTNTDTISGAMSRRPRRERPARRRSEAERLYDLAHLPPGAYSGQEWPFAPDWVWNVA